ncbi:unnamed protein product, partial [Amoebophrya sp. A25]|eukprot:GSA25T00022940001.1
MSTCRRFRAESDTSSEREDEIEDELRQRHFRRSGGSPHGVEKKFDLAEKMLLEAVGARGR